MTLGERIKQVRTEKNMTQTELAKRIGVSKQAVYKYESGIVTNIPFTRLALIAAALDVSTNSLISTELYSQDTINEFEQILSKKNLSADFKGRFLYALSRLDEQGLKMLIKFAQTLDEDPDEDDTKDKT